MYERFTDRARFVVQKANRIAYYLNHEYIGTEHILLALFEEGSGVASNALRNLFIDLGRLYREIETLAPSDSYSCSRYKRPQTPRVKQLHADANEEAELLDASYVGTEHLLLALVRQVEGVAAQALMNLGLNLAEIRSEVLRILRREIPVEKGSNVPPGPRPVWSPTESDRRLAMEKSAMYERFTDRARKVTQLANQEAQRFNHEYIGTEHILLGLVKEGSGVAATVLRNFDIDLRKIRLEVEKIVSSGPDMVTKGKLPQTPRAKKVIEFAVEEARNLNHNYIGTEHLLLGLLREGEAVAAQILMNLGLNLSDVRKEVLQTLGYEIASEENFSGWYLAGRWLRSLLTQDKASEGSRSSKSQAEHYPSAETARIRSLEQQLWNVRIVLGALAGAIAGALLLAQFGAIMGLLLGGLVAALGSRTLGILAGGSVGALLGCSHLLDGGGGLAGALLGALTGFLIAEVGTPSNSRGFLGFWRKK